MKITQKSSFSSLLPLIRISQNFFTGFSRGLRFANQKFGGTLHFSFPVNIQRESKDLAL